MKQAHEKERNTTPYTILKPIITKDLENPQGEEEVGFAVLDRYLEFDSYSFKVKLKERWVFPRVGNRDRNVTWECLFWSTCLVWSFFIFIFIINFLWYLPVLSSGWNVWTEKGILNGVAMRLVVVNVRTQKQLPKTDYLYICQSTNDVEVH